MATLKERVEELRSLLVTVLVDPSKTTTNNRIVDLLEDIAATADSGAAAINVTPIADPGTATATDVANKVNEVIAALS